MAALQLHQMARCASAMKQTVKTDSPDAFLREMNKTRGTLPKRIDANLKRGKGLAKLVLTLIELIRKLMEKQAMRRIENAH